MATDFSEVRRVAGSLCLDFVNTVAYRLGRHPLDHLTSSTQVLDWLAYADLIPPSEHERLLAYAEAHPTDADKLRATSVALRETLYRVASALVDEKPVPQADRAHLDRFLAWGRYAVGPSHPPVALTWHHDSPLEEPLAPILTSAVELLSGAEHGTLRRCQADDCGWFFLDTSRTQQRRWCSMRGCGTRAKARRHYQRLAHAQT